MEAGVSSLKQSRAVNCQTATLPTRSIRTNCELHTLELRRCEIGEVWKITETTVVLRECHLVLPPTAP
jgi:hypothetical protein